MPAIYIIFFATWPLHQSWHQLLEPIVGRTCIEGAAYFIYSLGWPRVRITAPGQRANLSPLCNPYKSGPCLMLSARVLSSFRPSPAGDTAPPPHHHKAVSPPVYILCSPSDSRLTRPACGWYIPPPFSLPQPHSKPLCPLYLDPFAIPPTILSYS